MGIFGKKKEDVEVKADQKEKSVVEASEKKIEKKAAPKKSEISSTAAAYNAIVSPVITEKSHDAVGNSKYTFRVATDVSKGQIKKVVEEMYGVTVENINTVTVKPKRRTVKYDRGYQKLYKKAIVTVKKGDKIAVFEGV